MSKDYEGLMAVESNWTESPRLLTEEAPSDDRQKENLCPDIKTNKTIISLRHMHKHTQTRGLITHVLM